MKAKLLLTLFLIASLGAIAIAISGFKQKSGNEPWTEKQLAEPADLARTINDPQAKQPVVLSIGPGAMIKGSIDIGPAKEKDNLNKLRQQLGHLPKNADIILYCGCCPFQHCPNIRPAFSLLNEMKFTNHKLLNLQHNLRIDWIDKGYPIVK